MDLYQMSKILNPIHTTAKPGVNVQELVKDTFSGMYVALVLCRFDWNDLDSVLDYLYGVRKLLKIDTSKVIKLIEDNSEVH